MNEFAEILNLFIANVIAYTFFVAVYSFIIYNVGKIILYLIRYAVYHIRRDINKYKSNKDKQQHPAAGISLLPVLQKGQSHENTQH